MSFAGFGKMWDTVQAHDADLEWIKSRLANITDGAGNMETSPPTSGGNSGSNVTTPDHTHTTDDPGDGGILDDYVLRSELVDEIAYINFGDEPNAGQAITP